MTNSCSKCLHNDTHPFGITFVEKICSGCYIHEEKNSLDWSLKAYELHKLATNAIKRRSKSTTYDCIIPAKGCAEDYFVVEKVLDLGLNPLIVSINDYFMNDLGWHNLHNLITRFDLDSHLYSPNLHAYKELVATSFRKYLHVMYPSLSLNASYPVHVAIERNIPLIIWGQLQPIEQVGKFSHLDSVQMTKWSQLEHDRLGQDITKVIGNGAQLNPTHLIYYDYPLQGSKLGFRAPIGIYLSNYIRWDPLSQNHSILKYGFKPQLETATFDPYERAGSSVYYTCHELSRLLRHGYRKVRDHLNREIRHNRIDRCAALKVYSHYSCQKINLNPFFDWLGITKSGKDWIIQHLLSRYIDLLDESSTTSYLPRTIPESIKSLISTSYVSQTEFIAYGKGI